MFQTLFHIPHELVGIPVFGWGWALWIWIAVSACVLWSSYRRHGWGPETKSHLPVLAIFAFVLVAVLPRLESPSPTEPGAPLGVPIRGFGVMLMIAVVSAVGLALRRARQLSFNQELIYSLAIWVFVSGIVGARFFYVVQKWEQFGGQSLINVFNVTQGGIVIYGGLIGGAIGFMVFVLRNRLPPLAIGDLIAPSLLLGMAIGRIGCFFNGCCYGGACELPWAVTFPPGTPPYEDQLRSGTLYGLRLDSTDDAVIVAHVASDSAAARAGLEVGDQITRVDGRAITGLATGRDRPLSEIVLDLLPFAETLQTAAGRTLNWQPVVHPQRSRPVHPSQIYSTLNALVICVFLLAYFPFQRRDGESFAWFMTLYPISRFMLEMIRNDEHGMWGTGLTISQNISIVVLLASIPFWFYVLRQPRGTTWQRWYH